MAIAVYFHPQSMSAAQYDEVIQRLEKAGAGQPRGRIHHSIDPGQPDVMPVHNIIQ